jgi:hypothetical protein
MQLIKSLKERTGISAEEKCSTLFDAVKHLLKGKDESVS